MKGVGIKNNRNSHFNVIFPAVPAAYDVLITDDAHEHQLLSIMANFKFCLTKEKKNISEYNFFFYIYINYFKCSNIKQLF